MAFLDLHKGILEEFVSSRMTETDAEECVRGGLTITRPKSNEAARAYMFSRYRLDSEWRKQKLDSVKRRYREMSSDPSMVEKRRTYHREYMRKRRAELGLPTRTRKSVGDGANAATKGEAL